MRRAAPVLILTAILSILRLGAQAGAIPSGPSLEELSRRAERAISRENYETAIRLLEAAKKSFPAEAGPNLLLGDLYYDKRLFAPALEEFLQAEKKHPGDFTTLSQIAHCQGKMNREEEAIRVLERLLTLYPDSLNVVDDLGWMYFKTFQLDKGVALIRKALSDYGPDAGLLMTLGTLYSGLYDYESSRSSYLKAIREAQESGDEYFVSVAYYNLSLLERHFYRYPAALRATESSLRAMERAPGHLARGELYLARLDYPRALAEYQRALVLDNTPLSKINLAILYRTFGRLELARRYAEEVYRSEDLAWMYYYGTDLERHYKDIHEILADIHQGLAQEERLKPRSGILEAAAGWFDSLRHRLLAAFHSRKYRLLSIRVGRAFWAQSNWLDASFSFFQGNPGYPDVALSYLDRARKIETRVSPHTEVYYLQEEGKTRRSIDALRLSLEGFDPFWERDAIAESLIALIPLLPREGGESRQALERLYALNPGALQQNGFGLPLELDYEPAGAEPHPLLAPLAGYLKAAGSEVGRGEKAASWRFRLVLESVEGGRIGFRLEGRGQGKIRDRWQVSESRAASLAAEVLKRIYGVEP